MRVCVGDTGYTDIGRYARLCVWVYVWSRYVHICLDVYEFGKCVLVWVCVYLKLWI